MSITYTISKDPETGDAIKRIKFPVTFKDAAELESYRLEVCAPIQRRADDAMREAKKLRYIWAVGGLILGGALAYLMLGIA